MDDIDAKLMSLLEERFKVSKLIGIYKKENMVVKKKSKKIEKTSKKSKAKKEDEEELL